MHRRWHVVQAYKSKVTFLLSMKGRKSLGPHDQVGFKEQVWLELHLKGGKEFDNRADEQRRGDVETGSLETFNLQNVLRGLWEDKLTGRRGFWKGLVIKL